MNFKTLSKTSITSLLASKIRSLLTISGIIIGVFAIITLISLVKGLENYVVGEFKNLGSNLIFAYPGSGGIFNDPALSFFNNKFSEEHVNLIKRDASSVVKSVEPIYQTGGLSSYKNNKYMATIIAGSDKVQDIFTLPIEKGRKISNLESKMNSDVAVLGSLVKKELFGSTDPIGKAISIEGKSFEVVGYMREKNPDYDPAIFVPLKKATELFDLKNYTYILVELRNSDNVFLDSKTVEIALLKDLTKDDFTLYSADDLLGAVRSILDILRIGLIAVAGISLLVGGIGIMNIMLVSVTERTREIGLRKALGATKRDITLQFLLESALLSSLGGILGLFLGFFACLIARNWIPSEITVGMAALSIGFSLFIGVLFGTYPAIQASKLDAIEALRYE